MIQLDVIAGPNTGASFEAEEDCFIIGRARTSRIILLDKKVSARHAEVSRRDDRYRVRDLSSTNGTYVNGRAVQEARVRPGDELRVGQTILKVAAIDLDERAPTGHVSISDADAYRSVPVHARVTPDRTPPALEGPPEQTSGRALVDAYRNLLAMYKVSSLIQSNVSVDKLLDEVLGQVFRNLRAERGVVMLFDGEGGELVPRAFRSRSEGDETEMRISRTIVNEVVEKQQAVLTSDATVDERFSPADSVVQQDIRSAMCAPLSTRGQVLGIIYVDCRSEAGTFKKSDLEQLTAIANEACVAVENQSLHQAKLKAERLAAVGQTVAGLSHYIKNVLTCMEAGADIVADGLKKDRIQSIRKGWNIVNRNERKIAELVLDMLSYSTDRTPARTLCDLNQVVRDVAEDVEPVAEADGTKLDLRLDPALPEVTVDSRGMHRCILNLVNNALDAVRGHDEPAVTVATEHRGGTVAIRVADNGPGIPDELKPKIFDVFVSTKGDAGTGLGLAVVRKIVHEHAGEIDVRSDPNRGAEFTIHLVVNPTQESRGVG
ncbi:MAG: ATP-binding protein [Planctomycetota bacterium]